MGKPYRAAGPPQGTTAKGTAERVWDGLELGVENAMDTPVWAHPDADNVNIGEPSHTVGRVGRSRVLPACALSAALPPGAAICQKGRQRAGNRDLAHAPKAAKKGNGSRSMCTTRLNGAAPAHPWLALDLVRTFWGVHDGSWILEGGGIGQNRPKRHANTPSVPCG